MNITAVSFNIRYGDDPDGYAISERAPRLDALVTPLKPDVIGFQEYTVPWEKQIEKYFGEKYEIFNKYRAESNKEGTPILWKKDKFHCLKKGYFWLSDTPEVESKGWDTLDCCRICIYAVLKDKSSGKIFTFMNTHFGFGEKCQVDSAKLLYEYSQKISEFPTFITGDFNMTPVSAAYKEMTNNFTDVNAVTLKDFSDTFHGYNPKVERNQHIDYCFIDEKIKPLNLTVIDGDIQGKFPSDHYGLFVELEI
ncbi:MAG: hypothetical protein IJD45_03905 [Clostridia bacterium]|nr:hypothetical protein [Clostridia bacterium]